MHTRNSRYTILFSMNHSTYALGHVARLRYFYYELIMIFSVITQLLMHYMTKFDICSTNRLIRFVLDYIYPGIRGFACMGCTFYALKCNMPGSTSFDMIS